ncbi:MAG: hypothetical protein Q7S29_06270 [Candidatus Peribacter sp.]|nr:hypothetical protein [Candidatus Peribacter sp.]
MDESPPPSSGFTALQNAETCITKIGGENAADLRTNAEIVRSRTSKGKKQVLAISALRSGSSAYDRFAHELVADHDSDGLRKSGFNTTSHLIAVAEHLRAGNRENALDLLERVRDFTKDIVQTEISQDPDRDQPHAIALLYATIDRILDAAADRLRSTDTKPFAIGQDWILRDQNGTFSITGIGEELAKAIYHTYFHLKHIAVGELSLEGLADTVLGNDPRTLIENERTAEGAVSLLRETVRTQLETLFHNNNVIVAGGYLPLLGSQRGYSDKTGALLAQAAKEAGHTVAYLIEKKSPITSADPKKIPHARVVPEMTYELAMEAFGSLRGANGKAVHPEALRMLAEYDIPALVMNPRDEAADKITHIHRFDPQPNGVDIVASRRMPLALEIESISMLGHAGFVHAVTQWFVEQDPPISIDQISTSEVTLSFTFSNGDFPEEKVTAFKAFLEQRFGSSPDLKLSVTRNKSLLFCMGNNMKRPGVARDATAALTDAEADIHFISQGFNERVMTFVVDADKAPAALAKLHEVCIERKP